MPHLRSAPARPQKRSLWQRLFERAQATVRYDWFLQAEVARYDAALAHGKPTRLDDATWSDLELDRYLDHLATPCSIFGRQMLYHRLRAGGGSPAMTPPHEAVWQAAAPALAGLHQVETPKWRA